MLENDYWNLVEQQFALKHYGKLSLYEQETLTAEERSWWINRLNQANQEQNDLTSRRGSGQSLPPTPGRPPIDV